MVQLLKSRWPAIAGFLAVVALSAAGIWRYGYMQALDQLAKQGQADLALASDRFTGQLSRYREMAVLMAEHPVLTALGQGGDARAAERLLVEAADKTGAVALVYADTSGRVLAATGPVPQGLSGTAYFRRAMTGALGAAYGRLGTGDRVYIYAAPGFGAGDKVAAMLIVLVDIAELEWDWIGGQPPVFFTTSEGEVFLSNRSELIGWQSAARGLQPPGATRAFAEGRTGPHEIWTVDWGDYLPARSLHLRRDAPVIDMTGHALIDIAPARRLAGLQASVFALVCLIFGAILLQTAERRRVLARANAQLEGRVAERTAALEGTNRALRHEITERQEAEAALKRAQADLVQAGKLGALGQLAAGISHELNQPLMAIRQFAENGAQFMARGNPDRAGDNLGRISGLAARMARIIANLRAFARQESEPVTRVDLVQVVGQSLELTEPRLKQDGIQVDWAPPARPVYVQGGDVRLGQVLINLISNAADAMAGRAERRIEISVDDARPVTLTVRDTGPGIAEPEKIFEPFYSTKEVGASEGMGLGLSISYGLVQSFGGDIRGRNVDGGGAEFRIELARWPEEAAA